MTIEAYRHERKFHSERLSAHELEALLRRLPLHLINHYPSRWVNSLYFDDKNLSAYHESVEGILQRKKYRLRWYGKELFADDISDAVLEIKQKHGEVGRKYKYPVNNISTKQPLDVVERLSADPAFDRQTLAELRYLTPTLLNQYRRSYWISADQRFRFTIDSELSFIPLSSLATNPAAVFPIRDPYRVVVEMKYEPNFELEARQIIKNFPLTLMRHSKYCIGIDRAYNFDRIIVEDV